MATDESDSSPQIQLSEDELKKHFENIVEAIEESDDAGKKEFTKFCTEHNEDSVQSIVCRKDKRDVINKRLVFLNRSLIKRKTFTLLHYAVFENCPETVKMLIEKGADPAAEHEMQGTALHFASPSAKCDVEMLKTIFNTSERIGKKINKETVNKVNGFAWTALFYAIEREDKLMLEFLLKNGADATSFIEEFGGTSFVFTAWLSSAEIFKFMVDYHGLDSDSKENKMKLKELVNDVKREGTKSPEEDRKLDINNRRILFLACRQRCVKLVETLLIYGADPSLPDETGRNAVHYAVECRDESILKQLLKDDKLKVDSVDKQQHSALWYALENGVSPNIVQLLMKRRAKVTKLNDSFKEMKLSRLITDDNYTDEVFADIVSFLDQDSFERDICTEKHFNIFQLATSSNKPAKLKILLEKYEDLLERLQHSKSSIHKHLKKHVRKKHLFHIALKQGCSPDVIDLLNDCSCYKDLTEDDEGNTPLHCLTDETREDSFIKFMKIDVTKTKKMMKSKNQRNRTPLDIAMKTKQQTFINIFVVDWDAEVHTSTLLRAIRKKRPECSSLFVKKSKDIFSLLQVSGDRYQDEGDMELQRFSRPEDRPDGTEEPLNYCEREDSERALRRPFIELIKEMPDVAKEALDRCEKEDSERALYVVDDYESPEHPLKVMIKYEHSFELLRHSVVTRVMNSKLYHHGYLFYFLLLSIHILYIGFLSAFSQVIPNPRENTLCSNSTNVTSTAAEITRNQVLASFVIIFAAIKVLTKSFHFFISLYNCIKEYLTTGRCLIPCYWFPLLNRLKNYFEIFIYTSAIVISVNVITSFNGCLTSTVYNFVIFIVALSWINFVIFLSHTPFVGVYARIFITITKTFLKLALFALLLVIGATLVLVMLFSNQQQPTSPFTLDFGTAMVKVITMVTGELGFEDIFSLSYDIKDPLTTNDAAPGINNGPPVSAGVAYFLWILFLVFMPILLSNMLTGLAVGDVEKIINEATLKKIINQVDNMMELERTFTFINCRRTQVKCVDKNCLKNLRKFIKKFVWDDETKLDR